MQRFEAYEDRGGNWRWRLWAGNEKIVASSGESFSSKSAALRAAEGVRETAPAATISVAPGLGIEAALRLRALLADGDSGDRRVVDLQQRRLRAVAPTNSKVKVRRVRRRSGSRSRSATSP
jgi:uncharacterized protein YegP (UPF0339 family)